MRFYNSSKTGQENIGRLQRNVIESGDLAHWMGDLYARVVEKCLKCDWGKGKWGVGHEDGWFHHEFYEDVVKQLDNCVV
jgi:hypothetical protein